MDYLGLFQSSDYFFWVAPILYFIIFCDTYFMMNQVLNAEIYCVGEKPLNFENYLYSKSSQMMGHSELLNYK